MGAIILKALLHPGLAIGSTVLWGILEFIALQRTQRTQSTLRAKYSTSNAREQPRNNATLTP